LVLIFSEVSALGSMKKQIFCSKFLLPTEITPNNSLL